MPRISLRSLGALAVLATTSMGTAHADFSYLSTPTPAASTVNTPPGHSEVTLGLGFSTTGQSTPTNVNLFSVHATSTAPDFQHTDSLHIAFTDTVTLTNLPPDGVLASGSLAITGSLDFTRLDKKGEISSLTMDSPSYSITVGQVDYTFSDFRYALPTVNGTLGSVSALVTSSLTPV